MAAYVPTLDRGLDADTVHLFCGIGGDTQGFAEAGFRPVAAANHTQRNIETHAANFPDTEHLCVDLDHYDMRRLPRARGLWASPICTEISPSGGRKRRKTPRGQTDLLEQFGHVTADQWERTRATAYDILRAAEIWDYEFISCENVIEFATDWPLYDWWLEAFRKIGYNVTTVCVSSAHVWDDDNDPAAQWRDRWYGAFTRKGIPTPDLEPRPIALCPECGPVRARQSWKNPRAPRIGKYRQQYVYRCPNSTCRHQVVEPFVAPAISILDMTNVGTRIGDRKRDLAASTRRRIQVGLDTIGRPALVTVNHAGDDVRAVPVDLAPLSARTTRIGDGLACPPMLVPSGGTWADAVMDATAGPMRTQLANPKGFEALVTPDPFVAVLRGNATAKTVHEPLTAITAAGGASQHAVVTPQPFMVEFRNNCDARSAYEPLTTIATGGGRGGGHHALVVPYYSKGVGKSAGVPLDTVTVRDRFALVTTGEQASVDIDDCYLRMVQPRESALAQRFPRQYVLTGNKGEQTAGAGNAVSVNVAHWIAQQIMAVLDGRCGKDEVA